MTVHNLFLPVIFVSCMILFISCFVIDSVCLIVCLCVYLFVCKYGMPTLGSQNKTMYNWSIQNL